MQILKSVMMISKNVLNKLSGIFLMLATVTHLSCFQAFLEVESLVVESFTCLYSLTKTTNNVVFVSVQTMT